MIDSIKKTLDKDRIMKFLGVGGFCAILNLVLVYSLTDIFKINYLFSTIIAIIIVNFVSFFLNKRYTFVTKKKLFWRELWKYYSVMTSSYVLNVLGVFILVDLINIWYFYANIIFMAILTPFNYILHHNWSFKKKRKN